MSEQVPQGTNNANSYNSYAYPGAPGVPGPAAAGVAPKRPKQVDSAFVLLMVTLALTVLSVPAGIFIANADGNTVTAEGVVLLVALGVICLAFTLVAAIFIRKGHNWARILLAVYTGLSVLSLFTGTNLLGWWGILALVVATVMVYRKPSPAYFKEMSQYRQHKALNQAY
ncbi:hypothetical protein [Arthrobacter sp. zg-Y1171]|uniref:hypothetical protein n=1 Tax=Arthrobacter sp. zg-Y1171 TaxID=2964610 RepID=UPI0021085668|nr:hypothetical protein [Arthrobacter sp. zg-Y1171]MCQ1996702.1 hypothetical protein [Arthrobacter sp. zg-Y1171]UWX82300.1 hypothetical protein N2L00_02370 [Arthrobacter sp. zg-Y1171]